jgi:hypothetical protein
MTDKFRFLKFGFFFFLLLATLFLLRSPVTAILRDPGWNNVIQDEVMDEGGGPVGDPNNNSQPNSSLGQPIQGRIYDVSGKEILGGHTYKDESSPVPTVRVTFTGQVWVESLPYNYLKGGTEPFYSGSLKISSGGYKFEGDVDTTNSYTYSFDAFVEKDTVPQSLVLEEADLGYTAVGWNKGPIGGPAETGTSNVYNHSSAVSTNTTIEVNFALRLYNTWFQISGGDVHAQGDLISKTPPSAELPELSYYRSCTENKDDEKIYCFAGYDGGSLKEIVQYVPVSNSLFGQDAELQDETYGLSCVQSSFDDRFYCLGGTGSHGNRITNYDWVNDGTSYETTRLPTSRSFLSCAEGKDSAGNVKIYCFGGNRSGTLLSEVQEFDPSVENAFTNNVANFTTGRDGLSCVKSSYNEKIYCFGGYDGSNLSSIVEFDPSVSPPTLTLKANLPVEMKYHSCAEGVDSAGSSKIYCFGGSKNSTIYNSIYWYDPATNGVSPAPVATLPSQRLGHSCATDSARNRIYCFGGLKNSLERLDEIVEFNPVTNVVTQRTLSANNVFSLDPSKSVLSAKDSMNVRLGNTSPQWLLTNYSNGQNKELLGYDQLHRQMTQSGALVSLLTNLHVTLTSNHYIFDSTNSLTIDCKTAKTTNPPSFNCKGSGGDPYWDWVWEIKDKSTVVVFVKGDLIIKSKIDVPSSSSLTFVVSGNIVIDKEIGNSAGSYYTPSTPNVSIEGVYLADGKIITTDDPSVPKQLIGEGIFVGWGGFDLDRDLGGDNMTHPPQLFIYRPSLSFHVRDILKRSSYSWREKTP